MATPDRTRAERGPTGWVVFAAVMMIIIGFLNFFYGLAAVLNDQVVVVGGHGAIIADLTTWGWLTLILGVVLVLVGFALVSGADWARWTSVFLVGLNAIGQVWIFTAAPLWAFLVIVLDVIVIYNLTAKWSEPV
jgi:hypothetical protein